jgi:hypothetical protein
MIDALYCLRSVLQLRREHQLDTYILFVNLVKAFDTANHALLFQLLAKFGAPSNLIDIIQRLHTEFKVELSLSKDAKTLIDITVGVKQGDNMAGLLFLFLIQAMDESYTKLCKWKSRPQPEFRMHRLPKHGRILHQPDPTRTKGVPFLFSKAMFADEVAHLLLSRDNIEASCSDIFQHLKCFGLIMHVGKLKLDGTPETKSKTQAMYFPAKDISQSKLDAAQANIVFGQNNEFYIPFTNMFTYLGCHITQDLKDDTKIIHRINEAKAQVAALTNYFQLNADLTVK